jgi:hypothetical protein
MKTKKIYTIIKNNNIKKYSTPIGFFFNKQKANKGMNMLKKIYPYPYFDFYIEEEIATHKRINDILNYIERKKHKRIIIN